MICFCLSACAQLDNPLIGEYKAHYKATQKKVAEYKIDIAHYANTQIPPASKKQYIESINTFKDESIKDFFKKHKITERDIKWYLTGYNDLIERMELWKGIELGGYELELYDSVQVLIMESEERVDAVIEKMLSKIAVEKYRIGVYLQNAKRLNAAEFITQTVITPKEFETFFGQLNHDFEAMMSRYERMR